MNTKNIICRSLIALALLATATLVALPSASAHLRQSTRIWYMEGRTYQDDRGRRPSDPVNVVFFRGGTASLDAVHDHLNADWNEEFFGTDMDDWRCLYIANPQYMAFRARNDRRSGQSSRIVDERDLTMSNSRTCDDQDHTRLWDDLEHSNQTAHHGALNQWVIGNVHRDRRVPAHRGWHDIAEDWDVTERRWRDRMSEHCSYLRWRVMPGSQGQFNDFISDGYMLLLMMAHVSDPGPCPRRP